MTISKEDLMDYDSYESDDTNLVEKKVLDALERYQIMFSVAMQYVPEDQIIHMMTAIASKLKYDMNMKKLNDGHGDN